MSKTAERAVALTARQSRFVDEYLKDLNATQAYQRAGYKAKGRAAENNASRMLGNAGVQRAIQERMHQRSERTRIDADFVLHGIAKNISRCEQGSPVVDRNGDPVMIETPDGELAPAWRYDAANALKGYEMLGKHLKMFTDKVDHSSADGSMTPKPAFDASRVSTAALEELVSAFDSEK